MHKQNFVKQPFSHLTLSFEANSKREVETLWKKANLNQTYLTFIQ